MTTTSVQATPTYYEVAFGPDEADRQTYIDYGDGSFISRTAEVRAASFFLQLASARRSCGFWVNGQLAGGEDLNVYDDPPAPSPVAHKTRTFQLNHELMLNWRTLRKQYADTLSKAACACGWSEYGEDRTDARRRARAHREGVAA